jgi:hypothetical protein
MKKETQKKLQLVKLKIASLNPVNSGKDKLASTSSCGAHYCLTYCTLPCE